MVMLLHFILHLTNLFKIYKFRNEKLFNKHELINKLKEGGEFYKTVKKYFDHLESNDEIDLSENDSFGYDSDSEDDPKKNQNSAQDRQRINGLDKNGSTGKEDQELGLVKTTKDSGSKFTSGGGRGLNLASGQNSGAKEVDVPSAKDRQDRLNTLLDSKTNTKRKELEQQKATEKSSKPGNPQNNEYYDGTSDSYTEGQEYSESDIADNNHPNTRR